MYRPVAHLLITTKGGLLKIDSDKLEMDFDVPFSDDGNPAEATFQIYNMKTGWQRLISKNDIVSLRMGYRENGGIAQTSNIFTGHITKVVGVTFDGGDSSFEFIALEGTDYSKKKYQKTFESGTTARQAIDSILQSNLVSTGLVLLGDEFATFPKGISFDGTVMDALAECANRSKSLLYYNRGKIEFSPYKSGFDFKGVSVILDRNSGLFEQPTPVNNEDVDDDGRSTGWGGYSISSGMNPNINPRSKVLINSLEDIDDGSAFDIASQVAIVKSGSHSKSDADWTTDFEAATYEFEEKVNEDQETDG